ncbi:hypothetical protein A3I45_03010 [Candidatus Uhrbacteria bacterium RIFCSPLOWO2_02_FULL_53_10]|uniref:Uncharacterized protein n=1 Tax=Candidatus Uhrbacteria bacterium RIFCSPLOWO2_02_FULL_53_10 TaxID=1802411 RepID=A0A1F7VGS0_9BACT|nr:MAG: hypothetical protein A3I45_03010 [Candidatus Uhrbacteria bacterium RIFCSPLOWO2_02_FULL_53_10]
MVNKKRSSLVTATHDTFEYVIKYLPLCLHVEHGIPSLRVALHDGKPALERCLVDSEALNRVWHTFGHVPGWLTLLDANVSDELIVHTYVHLVAQQRVRTAFMPRGTFESLEWRALEVLDPFLCQQLKSFLRGCVQESRAFPCRLLPPEWTAAEYRLVREAIDGRRIDHSDANKTIRCMARIGDVLRTNNSIPTSTRLARTYRWGNDLRLERNSHSWVYWSDAAL